MLYATEADAPDIVSLERVVLDAERAGYAFVTLPDAPRRPGVEAGVRAAFLARRTTRIGLAPALHVTTTEPFHLATQLASLDHASLGRAGWVVGATTTPEDLATVGRTAVPDGEVGAVVDVARRLWDSWEDDAIVKDVATGRFLDPRKVHHVDFDGPGFSVVGPLITPRPPQGQVVVIGAADLAAADLAAAGAVALDVALVRATDLGELADRAAQAREHGAGLVFADVPVSVDGFNLLPQLLPGTVEDIVDRLVPELQERGVYRTAYEGATLREHLELPPC